MMPIIPVDTALEVFLGPLIDDTDFKTLETAVAYNAAGMDIDLIQWDAAGNFTITALVPTTGGANDWNHESQGRYSLELTALQNNLEGYLQIIGSVDGVLPFESPVYTVVPQQVYNSLVAGTDLLDITAVNGVLTSVADVTNPVTAGTVSDKTGYALTAGERTSIAAAVWNALTSGLTTAGSIGKKFADFVLGTDSKVILSANAHTGAAIPTVANVGTVTGNVNGNVAGSVGSLGGTAKNDVATAIFDGTNDIETAISFRQALRIILAATAGKLSGAATTTITIRSAADTKDRITATVDADGNRTAVVLDGS